MRDALIGYTGFVGGNLVQQHAFSEVFNSKNIHTIEGQEFDLVVCAGVKAQKWYANAHPQEDLDDITMLMEHLKKASIKRFVLISTIDVYPQVINVDETTTMDLNQEQAYGRNRLKLEEWVKETYPLHHIVRLPGLFGFGLKKNFIYDYLHPIPGLINENLFKTMTGHLSNNESSVLTQFYNSTDKGYVWNQKGEDVLLPILKKHHFTSLMFTDSRDQLQYYPLNYLWKHISMIIEHSINLINMATEPVLISDLHYALSQQDFINHLSRPQQNYNMKTIHDHVLGGHNGYLFSAHEVMGMCKQFVKDYTQ